MGKARCRWSLPIFISKSLIVLCYTLSGFVLHYENQKVSLSNVNFYNFHSIQLQITKVSTHFRMTNKFSRRLCEWREGEGAEVSLRNMWRG